MTRFTDEQLSADPILRYFHYAHLPMPLQGVSSAFCALAASVVESVPRNAERTVALRKLLEAKDAAVRANVDATYPPPGRKETFYDRLLAESKDLEARKEKLHVFINGLDFPALPADQQKLLREQFIAMDTYAQILGQRIATLTDAQQELNRRRSEEIDEGVRVTGGGQSEKPLPFRDDETFGRQRSDGDMLSD